MGPCPQPSRWSPNWSTTLPHGQRTGEVAEKRGTPSQYRREHTNSCEDMDRPKESQGMAQSHELVQGSAAIEWILVWSWVVNEFSKRVWRADSEVLDPLDGNEWLCTTDRSWSKETLLFEATYCWWRFSCWYNVVMSQNSAQAENLSESKVWWCKQVLDRHARDLQNKNLKA